MILPEFQNNLGIAYCKLPTGDRVANLQRAIACYEEALRFRTPESSPLGYAMSQNNLGNVLTLLSVGDQATNVQQAIACYKEALRFWTAVEVPLIMP